MLIPKVLTNDIVMHGSWHQFCTSYRVTIPGRDTCHLQCQTNDRRSFPVDGFNVIVVDVILAKQKFVLIFGKGALSTQIKKKKRNVCQPVMFSPLLLP